MVKGPLVKIFEKGRLYTISVRNVDKVANSARIMDTVTGRVVENNALVTPTIAFVKKKVYRVYGEARFDLALKYELSKRGIGQ